MSGKADGIVESFDVGIGIAVLREECVSFEIRDIQIGPPPLDFIRLVEAKRDAENAASVDGDISGFFQVLIRVTDFSVLLPRFVSFAF